MAMKTPDEENKIKVNGLETVCPFKYLRLRTVCELTGLSKTTVYEYSKADPEFPKPVKLGANCTAWRSDEVAEWMMSRPRAELMGAVA